MDQMIFKDDNIKGMGGAELTYDIAERVGKSLADWLPTQGAITIGYDSKPISKELAEGMIEGARLQGRNVWAVTGKDEHDQPPLAVAGQAIVTEGNDGVVTIELYDEQGQKIDYKSGLDEIIERVNDNNFVPAAEQGTIIAKK